MVVGAGQPDEWEGGENAVLEIDEGEEEEEVEREEALPLPKQAARSASDAKATVKATKWVPFGRSLKVRSNECPLI